MIVKICIAQRIQISIDSVFPSINLRPFFVRLFVIYFMQLPSFISATDSH